MSQTQNQQPINSNPNNNIATTASSSSLYFTSPTTASSTIYYSDPWSRNYSFKEDAYYHVMRDDEKVVDCFNYLSEVEVMSILDSMLTKGCDSLFSVITK